MNWLRKIIQSPKIRNSLGVIIIAAMLLELISAVQYFYSHRVVERELEHRAETELTMKAILIKGMLNRSEQLLYDYSWDIVHSLEHPDSVGSELTFLVNANRDILSAGVAFVPNYYPSKGYWFELFAEVEQEETLLRQIANESHDYTQMEFYNSAIQTGKPNWTDPYIDSLNYSNGNMLITTHSMPIHDVKGNMACVFAIDVSLDWLGDTLNARHAYPSSFDLLLTESGGLICKPNEHHVNAGDVDFVHQLINDSSMVIRKSKSGRSKIIDFISPNDGDKGYIFYVNMKGDPQWQLAVVCYDNEVYGTLNHMRRMLLLSMFAALGLLGLIVYRFARNERKLQSARNERERISSELRIARGLQMSMIPDDNLDLLNRTNVEIFGLLEPAVEVGGDLYDFLIRDEKLFFCIGDVSGKGIPSALVMAVVHSLFQGLAPRESDPAHIMQTLNYSACRHNKQNMFVTLFIGVLDLPTGRLRYCNAGHDVPVLIDDETRMLPVDANLPIGVLDDFKYTLQETILKDGQDIFLYTDGLTEAMNKNHCQFGEQRMLDVLTRCKKVKELTPNQLLHKVRDEVNAFVGGAQQSDDLTMLVIRYTPNRDEDLTIKSLTLKNDLKQVPELNQFVALISNEMNIDAALATQIKLAVEEAVVNVMDYAYPVGTQGDITIDAHYNRRMVKFIITDSGKSFDPTKGGSVDTTLSAEDRPIGGLGIFLVRKLMDSINYERVDGKNILTLTKLLDIKLNHNEDKN